MPALHAVVSLALLLPMLHIVHATSTSFSPSPSASSSLGVGEECSRKTSSCASGLTCIRLGPKKLCIELRPVGASCDSKTNLCRHGLDCSAGICVVPSGKNCLSEGSICAPGTVCAGRSDLKLCVMPMKEGNRCGFDPFWICAEGLQCRDQICRKLHVPLHKPCTPGDGPCVDGSFCLGPEGKQRCKKKMTVGKKCQVDPYWVCKDGLVCEKDYCRIPREKECTETPRQCVRGTKCVGGEKQKKCVKPKLEGEQCTTDGFSVCIDGLVCIDAKCSKPRVSKGGDCFLNGPSCVEGSVCVGKETKKKCVTPMPEGKPCGTDPFWVCQTGLICEGKICQRPRIPQNGDCTPPTARCAHGQKCVGPIWARRCVTGKTAGMRCGVDPFWVCAKDLICRQGRCAKRYLSIGSISCSYWRRCGDGFTCVGRFPNSRCLPVRRAGQRCGLVPSWRCAKGLRCLRGRCRLPIVWAIPQPRSCRQWCGRGRVCVENGNRRRCVRPMGVGKKCGVDPWWVCARGLSCFRSRCRVSGGGDCSGRSSMCYPGTVCVGPQRRRRCVRPMTEGKRCGQDPYWICAWGLRCSRGICRRW